MINVEKELEEIFKDPMFATDEIRIGDIMIINWVNSELGHNDKYETCLDGEVIAKGDDLFEVLRKTFC